MRKGWKAKRFHSIIFSLGFHSNGSLSRSKLSQWKQTLSCLWAVHVYVYSVASPAWKPPHGSRGLGLWTGSRLTGVHHVFNNRILAPSHGADNCQLKTLRAKSRAQRCRQCFPSYPCIAHSVSSQLAVTSQDFLVKYALHTSLYKITRLEIFFQLLKGTLVCLLTCPRQRLAGLSLPLCGLLWEFPALLLLRRLFKGSMNNLPLTKSGLKQVKTGPYNSVIFFFNSCKDRVLKNIS